MDPTRDEAWRASSKRLLDVWSSLAERYNIPLDQDDIIDLRTVKLVKDRGVVRRARSTFEIGYFGDPQTDESERERSKEGRGTEEVEETEEDDEIDALTSEPSVPVKIEMEKVKRHVPPFRAGDPDDASDLKAFLEEERRRKQKEGEYVDDEDEDDDDDDDDEANVIDALYLISDEDTDTQRSRSSPSRVASQTGRDTGRAHTHAALARRSRPPPAVRQVVAECALTAPEGDSEDELALCDAEQPLPVVVTPRPAQSAGCLVDLTTPSPKASQRDGGRSKTRLPTVTAASPQFARPVPPSPLSARAVDPPASHTRSLTRNLQLQTPPHSHSASSVGDGTPDILSSPISKCTSSPKTPKALYIEPVATSSGTTLPTFNTTDTHSITTSRAPKHMVEVVVPDRSSLSRWSKRTRSPTRNGIDDADASPPVLAAFSNLSSRERQQSKNKGKAKETRELFIFRDLSDDEPLPPPPPRMRRATTQPPVSSSIPSTKRRKRKRSSASSANMSPSDQLPRSTTASNIKCSTIVEQSSASAQPHNSTRSTGEHSDSQTSDDESGVFCLFIVFRVQSHHKHDSQITVRHGMWAKQADGGLRLIHGPLQGLPARLCHLKFPTRRQRIQHSMHQVSAELRGSITSLIRLSRRCRTHRRSTILHMP